jgi:transmembrane sensor
VALSDGSKLHLERGTHLETVINSDRSFEAVLHRGVVRFEVEPGGPRQWRIHAGAFDVQVVGTVFTVRRGARTSSVRVERGEVIVRGRAVPDGVKRLTAGDRFPSTTATASREIKARPSEPKRGEDEPRPSTTRAEPGSPKARDLQPDRISEAAGDDSVATLLRRADAARLSGHPERAVAPLQRILDAHPAHPHAGLAAFTLGRLQLTALRQPAQAAESLRRALELGVPEPLRESVRARRVQALARAHDGRADAAAQAYLDDFPEGRYRSEVGQWLAEP